MVTCFSVLYLQQWKQEQFSLLQQQQEGIVQKVMKNLRDSGVVPARSTRFKQQSNVAGDRLEQRLQALVHHSLKDSGLDLPHVTRPLDTVVKPQRYGKEKIISRSERSEKESVVTSRVATARANANVSPQEVVFSNSPTGRAAADTLRQSPSHEDQSVRRRARKRSNGPKRKPPNLGAESDSEPNDQQFDAVRSKVDRRTLAILEKSQALLSQTKAAASSGGASRNGFVMRMRQLDQAAEERTNSPPDNNTKLTPAESDTEPSVSSRPVSAAASPSKTTRNQAKSSPAPASPAKAQTEVVGCDSELLRPPEHPPENENEWENELARQILTIYATSVKAKAVAAGTLRVPSAGSTRPSSRSTDRGISKLPHARGALSNAFSLPALRTQSPQQQQTRPPATSAAKRVHYSWEPSQKLADGNVVVNMPKVPRPIWFSGTGAVKAVWCALAQGVVSSGSSSPSKTMPLAAVCDHQLCEHVRKLEAAQQFAQCITMLETLLITVVRAHGATELDTKLWKQLVVTCNAFASRCIDYKKFPPALRLIHQAEQLIHNSILVDDLMRAELLAYLFDTYAHYYYRRRKPHAGLQYVGKAHEIHAKASSWAHLAKCRLHMATLLSSQGKHADAMQTMASILELIEQNKLEDPNGDGSGAASAQKICLAAVCYNNLAVEQLHLRDFEAASTSSANAKRLAKLCLSYSNRWLAQFEATSNCVALAIAILMEDANAETRGKAFGARVCV